MSKGDNTEPILCFESAETFLASIGMPVSAFELHPIILHLDIPQGGSDHWSERVICELNSKEILSNNGIYDFTFLHYVDAFKKHAAKHGYAYIVSVKSSPCKDCILATGLKPKEA